MSDPKDYELTPEQLGERIRQAREAQGLSQHELAERVGRDQRSVSEYESGKRRIYAHDLPNFAQALNVPIAYFFQDTPNSDDLDGILLDVFHQLEARERQTFIEIGRSISQLLRGRSQPFL